MLMMPLFF